MRTKTSGVFAVKALGEEIYVGASTQIEIAFRDYMGWIKKNKAPKAIQAVADHLLAQGKELPEVIKEFSYNVVIECEDKAQLKELKKQYKEQGTITTPVAALVNPAVTYEVDLEDAEIQSIVEELNEGRGIESNEELNEEPAAELTVQERNELIRQRLAEGVPVKNIAEEFGVSKSTVYNVKNGRA